MKTYIVTGGAGFIGSHITEKLLSLGHKVIVLDNFSTGLHSNLPRYDKRLTIINVDISNLQNLRLYSKICKNVSGVFHLAAFARMQPSITDPYLTHDTNVTGTLNILEFMKLCGIKNIVYSASSSSYGKHAKMPCKENFAYDPENPYAATKIMGEIYCKTWTKLFDIRAVCLKYFNVWGPRSPLSGIYAPVIGLFFRQSLQDKVPMTIVGNGEQKRDFTYVSDVVAANLKAIEKAEINDPWCVGNTFNIGTGVNYTINQVTDYIKESLLKREIKSDIIYIPERIGEASESLADITSAKYSLQWQPKIVLKQQIDVIADYYINLFKS